MKFSPSTLVPSYVDAEMEWELIRRCRHGSVSHFEPLVRGHQRAALALAQALLGNAEDAADAVQEAFVKAFRALDRLRDGSAFGPWFRSILRNHCRDVLRGGRRDDDSWSNEVLEQALWEEPKAQITIERRELAERVRAALGRISAEHREILVLKEMEEMGYAEIAEAMGIPLGTVASRLYHARAALRKVLDREGLAGEGARP